MPKNSLSGPVKIRHIRSELLSLIFLWHALSGIAFSQVCRQMDIRVEGGGGDLYHLLEYRDGRKILSDSVVAGNEGDVTFSRPSGFPAGIYRLQSGQDRGLDFLVDEVKVVMTLDRTLARQKARVNAPPGGQIFLDYLAAKESHERRMGLLIPLLLEYPVEDTFYRTALEEAQRIDDEFGDYVASLLDRQGGSPLGRIVRLDLLEEVNPERISPKHKEFLKQHYFDGVDLTDSLLLRTPILPGKIISYLTLYVVPGQGREAQEKAFIRGADSLMKFTAGDPGIQAVVAGYLIDGFQAYGFEEVIRHIAENYLLKNTCVSEEETSKLKLRMEGFEKLAVGRTAPDFTATDAGGNLISLSGVSSEYRLLFFWSSECPHCKEVLPGLKSLAKEHASDLKVIGISVDSDEAPWRKSMEENGLTWTNIAELQGWDGPIVRSYYIYATPTFFLVDRQMKIVAKPLNINEVKTRLELKK